MKLSELRHEMRTRGLCCSRCGLKATKQRKLSYPGIVCSVCCEILKRAPIGTVFFDGKEVIDTVGVPVTDEEKRLKGR